ncbi:MAG: hypothetical protein GF383_14470 [Candidatus Lokiarchaeota archaeon]|nr:hypothetical protein [Candidatus Lokiarchaeota archaeon]MBD3342598.1 hypothetical protein [Candidatus Lokiarchaeota archaeon]
MNLYYITPFIKEIIQKAQKEGKWAQRKSPESPLQVVPDEKHRKKFPPKPLLPENNIKSSDKIITKRTNIGKSEIKIENLKKVKKAKIKPKFQKEKIEYLSEEDQQLDIPVIPEAIKKEKRKPIAPLQLDPSLLKRIEYLNNSNHRIVFVNCERCGTVIPIPVPKINIENSELPVIPISYIHKNLSDEENHCITIYLDKDFNVRRQRISDVVVSK